MSLIMEKCFPCYSGYECRGTNTITKEQRAELETVLPFISIPLFAEPCEGDLDSFYNYYKDWYKHIPFFEKYGEKLKNLRAWQEDTFNVEGLHYELHKDTIELFWEWEHDNGLYTTDGSMKALWANEKEDDTWSKDETKRLCKYFDVNYDKINNFEDFLKAVKHVQVLD